jgi:hypothetical protein
VGVQEGQAHSFLLRIDHALGTEHAFFIFVPRARGTMTNHATCQRPERLTRRIRGKAGPGLVLFTSLMARRDALRLT